METKNLARLQSRQNLAKMGGNRLLPVCILSKVHAYNLA